MKGKLIVIDGGDGSGKKTQAALLAANLEKLGYKTKSLDFPQYDSFFGNMVADYLNGKFGSLQSIHPKTAALLYALDRFKQKDKIKTWLEEGNMVILDRYVESNFAYTLAKLEDKKEKEDIYTWINRLEYDEFDIPRSDLVIYLHVPTKVSQELIASRPDKKYLKGKSRDIHEADPGYQQKVEEEYLRLSKQLNWQVIECAPKNKIISKDAISSQISTVVTTFLRHNN